MDSTGFNITYNLAGTLDGLALLDETIGTEQHDTDLAGLEVHAHTLDTGGEPVVMSVCRNGKCQDIGAHVLDQLLSLDVGHTVDTGDTVTVQSSISSNPSDSRMMAGEGVFGEIVSGNRIFPHSPRGIDIPDRQNTTGLGETSLLMNTTNALLQDGRDLGGLSLGLGGVGTDLLGGTGKGTGDSRADLRWEKNLSATSSSGENMINRSSIGRQRGVSIFENQSSAVFEMERVGMAMDEDGQHGMNSPRRHGQWPERPRRSGWTAAERS